jgi:hypothetical protein
MNWSSPKRDLTSVQPRKQQQPLPFLPPLPSHRQTQAQSKRLSYGEWKVLNDRAWRSAACQYFIRCAERVIQLAPLPEFHEAIDALKAHDAAPSCRTLAKIDRVYRSLRKETKLKRRVYGFTALGCVYGGLLRALWFVKSKRNCIGSYEVAAFAEAVSWTAGWAHRHGGEASIAFDPLGDAFRRERAAQDVIWAELFGEQRNKTGGTWQQYKERVQKSEGERAAC